MKIEAVTVSVNYSDYLSQIISNKEKLDTWVIVTNEDDYKCIRLCKDNKLDYILSDRFYKNGAIFAKGRGINDGISFLTKKDWILHLDSDVLLPDNFRDILTLKVNDRNSLYWSRRYLQNGKEFKFITEDGVEQKAIGYFQLWHSSFRIDYPELSINGAYDDTMMSESFNSIIEMPLNLVDVQDDVIFNDAGDWVHRGGVWATGRPRENVK